MNPPAAIRNAALAAVVAEALKVKGYDSIKSVSEATGIPQTTVYRRMRLGNFTTYEIFQIGDVLGTSGSRLLAKAEKHLRSERSAA